MSWIILFIAGLLEVVWAIGLKYTHGFTRLTPSVITVTAMIVSIALLGDALAACGNGLCRLDGHWRCGGGHYRHFAAG
jgi:quaternary ammonium compound-resistance protein SugE